HSYDEYHYDLAEIEHDPYVLTSILSAMNEGAWTLAEVQETLQMLFDKQYTLTENVEVETRYRTETDTWTDEEGNTHTDTYEVPYDYYICTVTLKNEDLSHVPILIMSEEQLSRFALYTATLGNRPDLFGGTVKEFTDYDVPEEYLADETFKAILTEAEKYLGYPYVWGGSNPSTSFDCSGFVSWVINHSGWDVGRLGATSLYNICTPTSSPRPGDLVFFEGTYDTAGKSHCGIYVGDGMMLHCGDPIGYADLNSSYWQAHFSAYGRLP
ncbi:MAG: C40 family peptidase, partial [Oscillospiraceae bacterium]